MEIFKRQLQTLDKIRERLQSVNKLQDKLAKANTKFSKSLDLANRGAKRLLDTLKNVFSVVKNIGFASLFGGGLLALKGVMGQKESIRSKRLGLSGKEMGALRYAGRENVADREFYIELVRNLKTATLTHEKSGAFARLGINWQQAKNMNSMELLRRFLESAKTKEGSNQFDKATLQEAIREVGGIDLMDLKTIDLSSFEKAFSEGLALSNDSTQKLEGIGKGINAITTSLDTLINTTLASVSPAIEKILKSISGGLGKIANNPEFQKMMDKLSKWALSLAENFDEKLINAFKDLPPIVQKIQDIFYLILDGLATASKVITLGLNENVNKFGEWTSNKVKEIEKRDKFQAILDARKEAEADRAYYRNTTGEKLDKNQEAQVIQKYRESGIAQPPINITINNDTSQAQVSRNFNSAINNGGVGATQQAIFRGQK